MMIPPDMYTRRLAGHVAVLLVVEQKSLPPVGEAVAILAVVGAAD
jgi:hypothetical protein